MQTQVKLCCNNQEIRISKDILREANISVNDGLDVKVVNGQSGLTEPFRHKTLEERAAEFDGKVNLDGEFDWGKPSESEVW